MYRYLGRANHWNISINEGLVAFRSHIKILFMKTYLYPIKIRPETIDDQAPKNIEVEGFGRQANAGDERSCQN